MAHAQRRLPVAEKLLRLALSSPLRPETVVDQQLESLNLLGAVVADLGRTDDAAEVFRQACDVCPGDPALWRNLGKAQWLGGDLEAAVEAYERAVDAATPARRLHYNAERDRTGRGHDAGAPGESPVAPRGGKPAPARTKDFSLEGLFADLISLHHARLDTKAAVAVRRRLVALVPDNAMARSDLLLSLHYLADLSAKELFEEHVAAGARMRPLDGTQRRRLIQVVSLTKRLRHRYFVRRGQARFWVAGGFVALLVHRNTRGFG